MVCVTHIVTQHFLHVENGCSITSVGRLLLLWFNTTQVSTLSLSFITAGFLFRVQTEFPNLNPTSHFCPLQVQLCVLLESSKELLSQGAFCPKLLWQEYRRDQVCVCVCVCVRVHVQYMMPTKVFASNKVLHHL